MIFALIVNFHERNRFFKMAIEKRKILMPIGSCVNEDGFCLPTLLSSDDYVPPTKKRKLHQQNDLESQMMTVETDVSMSEETANAPIMCVKKVS